MTLTVEGAPTILAERNELTECSGSGLTILFAESLSSNGFPGQVQNSGGAPQEIIDWSNGLAADAVRKHHGQVARTIAGSIMAEFPDPASAVRAAVEMERLLVESNRVLAPQDQPGLRIGIHGLAGHDQGIDVFGGVVHVAASITKHAASGQILISREVCDALSNQPDLHYQWFRAVTMEGSTESGDVFEVHWAEASANIPSRYEVLSQVGTGGMGIVYKVRDLETDDVIALKILKSEIAADPAMQENLRREVSLARKVTHKNVCRIHEFNRSNGTAYISMEFVEGESLLSRLHRSGPLPWSETLQLARQICSGLREAHIQGIVHRDLKPANIMVDRSGAVKIMDFGIARSFQNAGQMTGTLVGTPAYMAPEQVELKRVDARTDVYALGLLLYEIVTGSPAFDGETPIAVALKQLRESPKRPREIVPALPARAEALILKCLQKDPAKRFQSVDELAAALNERPQTKPAVSMWASFVVDFRRAGQDLYRSLQPTAVAAAGWLRQQDWRAFNTKRARKALAVGLGAACLLGGLAVLLHRSDWTSRLAVSIPTKASAEASGTLARASQSPTSASASTNAATPIAAYEVDLGTGPEFSSPKNASSIMGSPKQVPPNSKPSNANRGAKAQLAARAAARSLSGLAAPDVAAPAAQPDEQGSNSQKTDDTASDLSASVLPAAPPSAPAAAASKEEKIVADTPASPDRYFEVGSFKDSTWADQAVEKLAQLGFHAVSVHKNLLWMQSYQVRVGPYADAKDQETARKVLISQGFKPHPVK